MESEFCQACNFQGKKIRCSKVFLWDPVWLINNTDKLLYGHNLSGVILLMPIYNAIIRERILFHLVRHVSK